MRSLETWTSVIHSVAEWQGRHYRGSGSQHFTWVNTVQPLAACHSLYLVDSFMKFDTLFFPWKSCKFQQSFSGWPISVKLLLSDSSVRLSWTCCQNRVNVFISLTFFFLKKLPAYFLSKLCFKCRNEPAFFVFIMLPSTPLKTWTSFPKQLLYRQSTVKQNLDNYSFSWLM